MKLLKNDEVKMDPWLDLLSNNKYSNPFQTHENYKLFNSVDGYAADVFAIEDDGKYKALMVVTIHKEKGIKGFFSVRGIVYGGPLVLDNKKEYFDFLLKEVKKDKKSQLIYLEIRNHFNYENVSKVYQKNDFKFQEHLNVQLTIENKNSEEILAGMNATKRRQIRQSFKENAFAREAKDELEVNALFEILDEMYKTKVKLPLLPYQFFINLYRSDIGKVFVAIHNDKVIGGAFCVYSPGTTMNSFYYTDIRQYHKKIYASHLALYKAIDFAITKKLKLVDFMGAGKPNIEYGVRDYKLRFGGDLVEDGRYIIIYKPLLYKFGAFGLKMLAKLKK